MEAEVQVVNAIELFRSLPRTVLPPSAVVDFLHFISCGKPVVRTQITKNGDAEKLSEWCQVHGLGVDADEAM